MGVDTKRGFLEKANFNLTKVTKDTARNNDTMQHPPTLLFQAQNYLSPDSHKVPFLSWLYFIHTPIIL